MKNPINPNYPRWKGVRDLLELESDPWHSPGCPVLCARTGNATAVAGWQLYSGGLGVQLHGVSHLR